MPGEPIITLWTIRIAVLGLILSLAGGVSADPLADGRAAYSRGDYATAPHLMWPKAEQGGAEAQNSLGLMYVQGLGVPKDEAVALAWFRKAAEQGHAAAQSGLGMMYATGQGVSPDLGKAYLWFRLAALRATDTKAREMAEANLANVAPYLTPEQIADAQRQAATWVPTSTP